MKTFKMFAIKKATVMGKYLIIPHPFITDIEEIIEEFNEFNNSIEKGCLILDIERIIGNRKGRYISLKVENYMIDRSTKEDITAFIDELEQFKIEYYSTLSERIKKLLLPKDLRVQVYSMSS